MLPTALVPVRISPTAKRRLAHVLGPKHRMRLVQELFEHVISVLLHTGARVVALTPAQLTAPPGIEVWEDEAVGLNGALRAALRRIGPPVLVVHADLPRLGAADIDRVLASPADVVVARAYDGGTNGLLLRRLIPPGFGPGSALVHAARARTAGLQAHVVQTPGFAFDVDDETALSAYGAISVRGRRP